MRLLYNYILHTFYQRTPRWSRKVKPYKTFENRRTSEHVILDFVSQTFGIADTFCLSVAD